MGAIQKQQTYKSSNIQKQHTHLYKHACTCILLEQCLHNGVLDGDILVCGVYICMYVCIYKSLIV